MSQISDRRVNNNCKLSHAGIRSCNYRNDPYHIHYRNDRSAAALRSNCGSHRDFTSTAAFQTFLSLLPYFSNFRRKERPIRIINNTYLVPTCYYPHQRKLIYDYLTLHLTAHSLVLHGAATEVTLCGLK